MEIRTANWIHMTKENDRANPRQIKFSEKDRLLTLVDGLPNLLGDTDWFLGGGLTIPLITGKFYRPHSDLDVNCNLAQFEEIVSNAQNKGYELYQRKFSGKLGKKKVFSFKKIDAKNISETNHRRLKLLKTSSDNLADEYAIDMFPYIRQGQKLDILYFHWTVLESEYLGQPRYNSSGQKIPMLDMKSIQRIKQIWHPDKFETKLDIEEIRKYQNILGDKN